MNSTTKDIWLNSLWKQNPGFVQLLGLCPLMAVTTGATTALGLGITTLLVMTLSSFITSACRNWIASEVRIPIFVLVIASLVTLMQMFINAYAYSLYLSLGVFLPLIVTNCIVIGRVESFAYRNPVGVSTLDGFAMGVGMMLALVMVGAIREIIGQGTIFKDLDLLFGSWAKEYYIRVFEVENNFLLATLAPGAFLTLGIIIAIKNKIEAIKQTQQKSASLEDKSSATSLSSVSSQAESTLNEQQKKEKFWKLLKLQLKILRFSTRGLFR